MYGSIWIFIPNTTKADDEDLQNNQLLYTARWFMTSLTGGDPG